MMRARSLHNDRVLRRKSATRSTAPPGFIETLDAVADVHGWTTHAQLRRLWECASEVPEGGRVVEIGSFHGRSAIVLARSAGPGVEIVAIDPHAGSDRGPREIHGSSVQGDRDHKVFVANLERFGVKDRVRYVRRASQESGPEVDGSIDLLYIDGAHRFGPARADIRDWGRRVNDGGTMLIHDAFSSVGVTGAIATELLGNRRFHYVGRKGSLAEYRCNPTSRRGTRWRSRSRQIAQLPWFVRNVAVKVLMLLHLQPLTRLLGHRSDHLPPF
jgi:predicted O-methyltransferase YrrM